MTQLEQVTGPLGDRLDPDIVQRNFDALVADRGSFGGKQVEIRFGTGSATWTAASTTPTVTVPHGLGRLPVFASASTANGLIGYAVTAVDATNLSVVGFTTPNTAFTGTLNFYWLAIG